MSGLFGGDDSPPPAPAPTHSPKGVKVVKTGPVGAAGVGGSILSNAMAQSAAKTEEENNGSLLGTYGGQG